MSEISLKTGFYWTVIKVGCPPKKISKTKNIHVYHEENVKKKIQKTPGPTPAPGLTFFP